jgi:hypothetical protein
MAGLVSAIHVSLAAAKDADERDALVLALCVIAAHLRCSVERQSRIAFTRIAIPL